MKKFRIILKSGQNVVWDAENEEEVYRKITTRKYKILPVRGRETAAVAPETLEKIEEILETGKE